MMRAMHLPVSLELLLSARFVSSEVPHLMLAATLLLERVSADPTEILGCGRGEVVIPYGEKEDPGCIQIHFQRQRQTGEQRTEE